ncbi:MAG: glutathione S-transferase family protein [Reinekea sp.]
MKLIGMLDSPFVRRTAISLSQLGIEFEHQSLSVFSDYDEFKKINPLVKAPTLVLANSELLIDSNLILQYAEMLSERSLYASDLTTIATQQHILGLSSIANEKTVQVIYEHGLRPEEKRHRPWLDRVIEQLTHTYQALERTLEQHPHLFDINALSHASIAAAVSWFFTQNMQPGLTVEADYPLLKEWSDKCEASEAFREYPYDFGMSPAP